MYYIETVGLFTRDGLNDNQGQVQGLLAAASNVSADFDRGDLVSFHAPWTSVSCYGRSDKEKCVLPRSLDPVLSDEYDTLHSIYGQFE